LLSNRQSVVLFDKAVPPPNTQPHPPVCRSPRIKPSRSLERTRGITDPRQTRAVSPTHPSPVTSRSSFPMIRSLHMIWNPISSTFAPSQTSRTSRLAGWIPLRLFQRWKNTAFLETLQSLELEFPRGDHKQIFYFICQFPNLWDLKINDVNDHINFMRNGGPRPDIKIFPPLDGTLDLRLGVDTESESDPMGASLILSNLVALPSGLKFSTIHSVVVCVSNGTRNKEVCNVLRAPVLVVSNKHEWAGA